MNVAYVRVSTAEQNEARQVEALRSHNIDKWFTEKISGKNTHRPQLQAMLDFVREGDTVYIHDFSRLARSTKDLLELVEQNLDTGVKRVTMKLPYTAAGEVDRIHREGKVFSSEYENDGILVDAALSRELQGRYRDYIQS